jgi:NTE family protein
MRTFRAHVTTDIISGDSVVLSEGSTAEAIVASTAIPGAFSPIHYKDFYLADGAISSNTPIRVAVEKGARRLIILPTGHACASQAPPVGAVANALHALTLLIARQLVIELETLGPDIEYFVVPPLCPLVGSPYDFSRTSDHIDRAILTTDARRPAWIATGKIPTRCGRTVLNGWRALLRKVPLIGDGRMNRRKTFSHLLSLQ